MPTLALSDLLHRIITRVRQEHSIRALVTLGVDEISYCKGRESIDRFFRDALSEGHRKRIQ